MELFKCISNKLRSMTRRDRLAHLEEMTSSLKHNKAFPKLVEAYKRMFSSHPRLVPPRGNILHLITEG